MSLWPGPDDRRQRLRALPARFRNVARRPHPQRFWRPRSLKEGLARFRTVLWSGRDDRRQRLRVLPVSLSRSRSESLPLAKRGTGTPVHHVPARRRPGGGQGRVPPLNPYRMKSTSQRSQLLRGPGSSDDPAPTSLTLPLMRRPDEADTASSLLWGRSGVDLPHSPPVERPRTKRSRAITSCAALFSGACRCMGEDLFGHEPEVVEVGQVEHLEVEPLGASAGECGQLVQNFRRSSR